MKKSRKLLLRALYIESDRIVQRITPVDLFFGLFGKTGARSKSFTRILIYPDLSPNNRIGNLYSGIKRPGFYISFKAKNLIFTLKNVCSLRRFFKSFSLAERLLLAKSEKSAVSFLATSIVKPCCVRMCKNSAALILIPGFIITLVMLS